jgi:hypothetical protein
VAAVVFLQLVPILFCFFILPAFAWGLGYWYLGRLRRFLGALLAAPLLLMIVPFGVYLGLHAFDSCQSNPYPGECQGWADLGDALYAVRLAGTLLVIAVTAMVVDAIRLARATSRERSRAGSPSTSAGQPAASQGEAAEEHAIQRPFSAPRSVRTPTELLCAIEAAGLRPEAADAAFWRSVRADWLAGDTAAEPFDDPAMNVVYAELLALRQDQPRCDLQI